jgi:hypothetical protein
MSVEWDWNEEIAPEELEAELEEELDPSELQDDDGWPTDDEF